MITKARKKHFRHSDTNALDSQFGLIPQSQPSVAPSPIDYEIPERASIVKALLHDAADQDPQAMFATRVGLIDTRVKLCKKIELRRRIQPRVLERIPAFDDGTPPVLTPSETLPVECSSLQCIFCLYNPSLADRQRILEYSKANKMLDHIDKKHLKVYRLTGLISCPHPRCKNWPTFSSLMAFKSHIAKEHGIRLRKGLTHKHWVSNKCGGNTLFVVNLSSLLLAVKAVNYAIYAMSLLGRSSSPKQYDFFSLFAFVSDLDKDQVHFYVRQLAALSISV